MEWASGWLSLARHASSLHPKGQYTAHSRTLAPKTILGIVFGTCVLKRAVYRPFGTDSSQNGRESLLAAVTVTESRAMLRTKIGFC